MLIPVVNVKSEIGLFTVVKKVEPETGRVHLRLVFDLRAPNQFWREPPWTPLAGPGAFASMDLDGLTDDDEPVEMVMVSGDLPDCFFHRGFSPPMSEWFAVPRITVDELEAFMTEPGDDEVLRRLKEGHRQRGRSRLGLRVLPMGWLGWSWSVFLAQSGLQEAVDGARRNDGGPLFEESAKLVEGAPAPRLALGRPFHFEYVHRRHRHLHPGDPQDGRGGPRAAGGAAAVRDSRAGEARLLRAQVAARQRAHVPGSRHRWSSPQCITGSGEAVAGRRGALGERPMWASAAEHGRVRGRAANADLHDPARRSLGCPRGLHLDAREPNQQEVPCRAAGGKKRAGSRVGASTMAGQDLSAKWQLDVMMYDASEPGGGVCVTPGTEEEARAEARWAVRGGRTKYVGDDEVMTFYAPPVREEDDFYAPPIAPSVKTSLFRVRTLSAGTGERGTWSGSS